MRVRLDADPFVHRDRGKTLWTRGAWPARWIAHPDPGAMPFVIACKRHFKLAAEETIRLHVSADERYQLYCDGVLIGRGPERGDADNWFFESYELALPAGRHTLVARVWSLGAALSPYAQMSVDHGLLVACDEPYLELLATGVAPWESMVLPGYTFAPSGLAWGTGARVEIDGQRFAWNFHRGDGDGWTSAAVRQAAVTAGRMEAGPSHLMRPAILPAMVERYVRAGRVRHVGELGAGVESAGVPIDPAHDLPDEREALQARLANHQPLQFEPHARRRIVIDLENYYCAYPVVVTTGGRGSVVRLAWAESLFDTPDPAHKKKGDRNAIDGKYFIGVGDTFRPDGGTGREFETLWWEAGRYVELIVEMADDPLELNLILKETRYPLEMRAQFDASDPRLVESVPILMRGLQMCAHETYVDCPYYEQLMYVGDARLEALATYAVSGDDRLARKSLLLFNESRLPSGLTQSRYPCRVRQVIPPFSLLWVAMVHDFAMWR
ncbi:MAG TPA: hypothetical protein VH475_06055, partial [Tepidisphaeraceae bacterium]